MHVIYRLLCALNVRLCFIQMDVNKQFCIYNVKGILFNIYYYLILIGISLKLSKFHIIMLKWISSKKSYSNIKKAIFKNMFRIAFWIYLI